MLLSAGALAGCLIAGSPQRLVGDGREYLGQAINFASFHGPAFRPANLSHIQSQLARFDPALADWDIWSATVADGNRGRAFLHFWFYALLATPGLWITTALGVPPTLAFTALNLALLGAALWIALPRAGPAACLLLFGGPVIWWIDKAHTEVFTFSLLTIAFALMRDRPWWSMLAAGAASIQNPPVAIVVPLVFLASVIRNRAMLIDRRTIAGAAGAVALALLHPLYSYTHYGMPSLLLMQTHAGVPTWKRLSAVVLDPTLGLVGNFPLFLIVVAAALIVLARRGSRHLLPEDVVVPLVAAAIFLFSFSRTTNVHHGGTPSLSRYALWLIPLAIPLLSALERDCRALWTRFLWTAAILSSLISAVAFNPSVPQNSREPTWLAMFLWTKFPAWNNPLPEVFIETELHVDEPLMPATTAGCEKILVAGGDASAGVWPMPCFPASIPAECQRTGAVCYANLVGRRYEFVTVSDELVGAGALRLDAVWPPQAVPHVQRLYEAWNWPDMQSSPDRVNVVRAADHVAVESLGSMEHFILVLHNLEQGAVLRLRPPVPMRGILVDALTGQTLSAERYDGASGNMMHIDLPHGFQILILAMRSDTAR
jgi:hypothetical protein